jgi:hypothetical protein
VTDLAGVSARAHHRRAADDDATADSDITGQVDEVVHRPADATGVLCQSAELGIVADVNRDSRADAVLQQRGETDVAPAQVGREPDHSCAVRDHSRDRQADANQSRVVGRALEHHPHHVHDRVHQGRRIRVGRCGRRHPVERLAPQAHAGHVHGVDAELGGQHEHGVPGRLHFDAGPTRTGPGNRARLRCRLAHGRQVLEFVHEVGDGGAVQPHTLGEVGAGHPAGAVDVTEQGREVVAADGFLVGTGAEPPPIGHS